MSDPDRAAALLRDTARCVNRDEDRDCRGRLDFGTDAATCRTCGHSYAVRDSVPVLRSDERGHAVQWYEEHYANRDRRKDLATDYLRPQRDRVAELAREFALVGPCLDVGCGTGLFADTVPQYIGLEFSAAALLVPGFEGYARIAGNALELPFDDATFEAVISFNVFEHIDDVARVYREIDRVLRPGGLIAIKPAWHCQKYTTELIPVRRYSELGPRQKFVKLMLPILRSKPYKLAVWLPWRSWRRMTARPNNPLKWSQFPPNLGTEWVEDSDACSNIDIHETILYFETRGYTSQSHTGLLRKLAAGHDLLVMTKGRPTTPQRQ